MDDIGDDIDDDTYTDPSIPCSGSTAVDEEEEAHLRVDKAKGAVHRSRRDTTESALTATVAAGTGQGTLLSPSHGNLGDHARYSTFVIHDDGDSAAEYGR